MRRTALTLVAVAALSACAQDEPAAEPTPSVVPADDAAAGAAPDRDVTDGGADAPSQEGAGADSPTPEATSSGPADQSSTGAAEPPPAATPSGTAPPPADGAPVAAPAGTYRYATDGETRVGDQEPRPMPEETTLVVSQPYNGAKQDRLRDLRDADGRGSATTTMFQHAGDGTYLVGLHVETTVEVFGATFTDTRDLVASPPALIAPPDLQPGDVATFHVEGDEMQADGTMTFVAQETLTVAGTEVLTNVIDVDVTFSGSVEGSSDSTWWVRPEDLLLVRETARSEATQGGVTFSSDHESMLLSLTPQ